MAGPWEKYKSTPSASGLKEAGNIDIHSRPVVKNPDGSISTVRSMSVNFGNGEALIPTVSDDGRIMPDEEAIQTYKKTGRHLGVFDTPENATAYANQLHNEQAVEYGATPDTAGPWAKYGAASPAPASADPKTAAFDRMMEKPRADTNAIGRNLRDLAYGATKGAADLVQGPAQLILNSAAGLAKLGNPNPGPAVRFLSDKADQFNRYLAEQERNYQADTPNVGPAGLGRVASGIVPFMATGGQSAAPAAPGLVNNLLRGSATGAVAGLTQPVANEGEYLANKAAQVGTGAFFGTAIPAGAALGRGLGRYAANVTNSLVQPFTDAGQEAITGRLINRFAEGGPMAINTAQLVPGSVPTLAEATGNAGIATLQRAVRDLRPNAFVERERLNAAARNALFDETAGDAGKLDFFRSARSQAAEDLYSNALNQANAQPLTPYIKGQISQLLKRPSIDSASRRAQKLAQERGERPAAQGSLQALHDVKTILDDDISEAVRAGKGGEAKALQATKAKLLDVMEKLSPTYREARVTYQQMSEPVNQMETLQGLRLTDASGNITLAKVQNALDSLDRRMTGPGTDSAKALTTQQIGALQAIRDDLLRQQNLGAGRSAGSNTFQNIATDNILESAMGPRLAALSGRVGVPTMIGQVGRLIYGNSNEAIRNRLTDMVLDPNLAVNALNRGNAPLAPQAPQNALMQRLAPYLMPAAIAGTTQVVSQP